MKCLSRETLFNYLNKELPESRREVAHEHILQCPTCRQNLSLMEQQVQQVIHDMDLLNPDTVSLRPFQIPGSDGKSDRRRFLNTFFRLPELCRFHPGLCRLAVGGAILFIGFIITFSMQTKFFCDRTNHAIHPFNYEAYIITDAKQDWNEKRLIITVLDENVDELQIIHSSIIEDHITREIVQLEKK